MDKSLGSCQPCFLWLPSLCHPPHYASFLSTPRSDLLSNQIYIQQTIPHTLHNNHSFAVSNTQHLHQPTNHHSHLTFHFYHLPAILQAQHPYPPHLHILNSSHLLHAAFNPISSFTPTLHSLHPASLTQSLPASHSQPSSTYLYFIHAPCLVCLMEMLHNTTNCGIGLQNILQYRQKSGIMT